VVERVGVSRKTCQAWEEDLEGMMEGFRKHKVGGSVPSKLENVNVIEGNGVKGNGFYGKGKVRGRKEGDMDL